VVNVAVLTHGQYGQGLINAVEMISGRKEGLIAVPLWPDDTPETYLEKTRIALAGFKGTPDNTLLLVDLFGGTPGNVAARLVYEQGFRCLTGANLPMLLEIMSSDLYVSCSDLDDLCHLGLQAGMAGLRDLNATIRQRGD
jgi:mannose/fructose/sorbose-specific phosphotransferase system IIA component